MQIPARYYDNIPKFYFIVGILLLANSIYLGLNNLTAYFYFGFGIVSVLYAVSVHLARSKRRNNPSDKDQQQVTD